MKKILLFLALLPTVGLPVSLHAQNGHTPKVIAHRGYWTAPQSAQNSLASWIKADSIGCYGAEFDVWLTGDDRLVVNHDRVFKDTNIDMVTASAKTICNLTLTNGETIPTLKQYLRVAKDYPNTRLILELKSLPDFEREDLAAKKVVRLLKRMDLVERTDIISFSLNACLTFRKLLPDNKIYYLSGDLAPRTVKNLGLAGIDYSLGTLRKHPEWIQEAHDLGLEVNVWTVNREEDLRECIQWNVDYITTDYPERLQKLFP